MEKVDILKIKLIDLYTQNKLEEINKYIKKEKNMLYVFSKLHHRHKLLDFLLSLFDDNLKNKLINTIDKYGNNFLYYCTNNSFVIIEKYFNEEQMKKLVNNLNYENNSIGISPNVNIKYLIKYINKNTFEQKNKCGLSIMHTNGINIINYIENFQNYVDITYIKYNFTMISRLYNLIILDILHNNLTTLYEYIEYIKILIDNGANIHDIKVNILNYTNILFYDALNFDIDSAVFNYAINREELKNTNKKIYETLLTVTISKSKSYHKK